MASQHAHRPRRELAAGHIILTGSLTAAVAVQAGDTITTTLDQLGTVTAVFD